MGRHGPLEVFYDGRCRLCGASRDWAERRDPDGELRFCDLNDPAVAASVPVSPERLREEMWVRMADGTLVGGFAGWLAVLRTLPRWRFAAGFLGRRPMRWFGSRIYRLVARHRHLSTPR